MAFRTWRRLLLAALWVSLLAGAGQLGMAFGFGVIRLTGTFTGVTVNQWPAQLVWVGWFAANAAVVGAVFTQRLARGEGSVAGTGRQLGVAAAAAIGALVVAPLCMQPARAAELISVDPVWAVGICAILGAVAGAGAALAVLLRPPLGWNMALVAGMVWLLALISLGPSLASTGPLPTVRLGVWEPTWLDPDAAQRLALLVLPLVALLAGAVSGGLARWRGHPPLVSGATGVAGPALVAFAYLTAGPGDAADRYQLTPYYGALLAVAAGALGSAAAALLRRPLVARPAESGAIEPTDILRPLPTGPALPRTATPAAERGAHAAEDEPETVDPAGAAPAAADRAATRPSGPATATMSGVSTPAHWDWPVAGRAPVSAGASSPTPAGPSAPIPTGADTPTPTAASGTPSPTTAGDAEAVTALIPAAPAPTAARRRKGTRGAKAAAPPVPAVDVPAAGPDRKETADEADGAAQPTARPAPKTRRTRKPRSTPEPADAPTAAATPAPRVPATDPARSPAPPPPATGPAPSTVDTPASTTGAPLRTAAAANDPQRGRAAATGNPRLGNAEAAPRPRHRAPMPDLSQAGNWEAFATARRGEPATTDAGPDRGTGTVDGADALRPPEDRAPAPTTAGTRLGGTSPTGATSNGTKADGVGSDPDEQSAEQARGRRGLFRRNRARAGEDHAGAAAEANQEPEPSPLPAKDAEYVDWVAGLSKPQSDSEPEQESGRRSLRSTGRHHRD